MTGLVPPPEPGRRSGAEPLVPEDLRRCHVLLVTCHVSRVTLPGQTAAVGEGHELGGVAGPRRDDGGPAAHPAEVHSVEVFTVLVQ